MSVPSFVRPHFTGSVQLPIQHPDSRVGDGNWGFGSGKGPGSGPDQSDSRRPGGQIRQEPEAARPRREKDGNRETSQCLCPLIVLFDFLFDGRDDAISFC